ncbi:MAG: hypothetical protein KA257_00745, partial [Opitutaceae bacterium]|nr:hypothetical protein [Opitutaceae bacterium]
MKKGIYLFQERKFNRYCVRIGKRLTGKKEQKKRFPFSAHLPPGVGHYHLAKPEDQKAARVAARL